MTGNRPPPAGCPRSADFDDYVREHYPALRRLAADPHPYVRRAVVNAASTWRLRRRLDAPPSALSDVAADEPGSDDRLGLLLALRSLPVGQRQVLVLRYYEGLSEAEIASVVGISTGTVKSRAARGLDALRRYVHLAPREASWT